MRPQLLFSIQELLQKYARPREAALRAEEALLQSRPQLPPPLMRDVLPTREPLLPFADSPTSTFGTTAAGAPLPTRRNAELMTKLRPTFLRSAEPLLPGMAVPEFREVPPLADEARLRALPTPIDPTLLRQPTMQLPLMMFAERPDKNSRVDTPIGPLFGLPERMDPKSRSFPRVPEPDPTADPDRAYQLGSMDYFEQLATRGQKFPQGAEPPWAFTTTPGDRPVRLYEDNYPVTPSRPGLFFGGQVEAPSDERLYSWGSGSERNRGTVEETLIDGEPGYRQLPDERPLPVHRLIQNMVESRTASGRPIQVLKPEGWHSDVRPVTQYRGKPLPPDTVGVERPQPRQADISIWQPLPAKSSNPYKWQGWKRDEGLKHQVETEGIRPTAIGQDPIPLRQGPRQFPDAKRLMLPKQLASQGAAPVEELLKIKGLTASDNEVAGLLWPLLKRALDNEQDAFQRDPDWTMAHYNQLRKDISKRAEGYGTRMAIEALATASESHGIPLSPEDVKGYRQKKTWDQKKTDNFELQAIAGNKNLRESRLIPTLGGVDKVEGENSALLPGVTPDEYTALAKGEQRSVLLPVDYVRTNGFKKGDVVYIDNGQEQLELRVKSIKRPRDLQGQDRVQDRMVGLRTGRTAKAVRKAVDDAKDSETLQAETDWKTALAEIEFELVGEPPDHVLVGTGQKRRQLKVNDAKAAEWAEGFADEKDFRKSTSSAAKPDTARDFNERHYDDLKAGKLAVQLPPGLQDDVEVFTDLPNSKINSPKPGYQYVIVKKKTGDAFRIVHYTDGTTKPPTQITAPRPKKGEKAQSVSGVDLVLKNLDRGSRTGNRNRDIERLQTLKHTLAKLKLQRKVME